MIDVERRELGRLLSGFRRAPFTLTFVVLLLIGAWAGLGQAPDVPQSAGMKIGASALGVVLTVLLYPRATGAYCQRILAGPFGAWLADRRALALWLSSRTLAGLAGVILLLAPIWLGPNRRLYIALGVFAAAAAIAALFVLFLYTLLNPTSPEAAPARGT
ncbi:MAG: hypothetical protein PSY12_12035, partial [bacterium]|nr:hypothetical protein [bacterium]